MYQGNNDLLQLISQNFGQEFDGRVQKRDWPKIPQQIGQSFLGIKVIKEVLILFKQMRPSKKKSLPSSQKSCEMIGQHFFKNSALNPSGPRDLLFGRFMIIQSISSFRNSPSSHCKSDEGVIKEARSILMLEYSEMSILSLKESQICRAFSP